MLNKIKMGFTLAEVLITLVIIGVVAALTIPTAINKIQDQELKSQFKKAYSTISQAINKTEINDFYGYAACHFVFPSDDDTYVYQTQNATLTNSGCTSFYNALAKHLNVQKICKGNSKSEGCVPDYQTYNPRAACWDFGQDHIDNNNYSYVLADGTILNVYSEGPTRLYPKFVIDINGHKGPNAYGKDLFHFTIKKFKNTNNVAMIPGGFTSCEYPVSGGRTTEEMVQYALAGKK